jgi:hypothetical protein
MDERCPDGVKNERKQRLPLLLVPYLNGPRNRSFSAVIVLAVAAIFAGVLIAQVVSKYHRFEDDLARCEALWNSRNITNYQYTCEISNWYGRAEFTVRVEDNVPVTGRFEGDISEVLPDGIDGFDTIPEYFDIVREKLAEKEELNRGSLKLTIDFDDEYGFPTKIMLAKPWPSALSQGYYSYRISDFTVLESPDDRYARLAGELDVNEALWQTLGTNDYEFTLVTGTGNAFIRNKVTVKDGIPSFDFSDTGRDIGTVPDMFERIRTAIHNREGSGFIQLRIAYDKTTGHPVHFSLRDSYMTSEPAVYSYSIVDLKNLE